MKKTFIACVLTLSIFIQIPAKAQTTIGENPFQQEFLTRINAVRQKGCRCGVKWMPPSPPLVWNILLQKAAFGHARDMDANHYFNHTSKDGRSMQDRIVAAGYNYDGVQSFAIGENIAWGQQTIAQVTDEWFKSEGHCKNLMNPSFKEVGVVQYNLYWVQDFGGRIPFTADQQKLIKDGKGKVVFKEGSK